jgi:hypothetical protein
MLDVGKAKLRHYDNLKENSTNDPIIPALHIQPYHRTTLLWLYKVRVLPLALLGEGEEREEVEGEGGGEVHGDCC